MKMYVLVRRDLTTSQQAVQAGHAVAELLLRGQRNGWDNGTLVYLGVKNEDELRRWKYKLSGIGLAYSEFKEPDMENEITAISCVSSGEIFSKLRLL
jgi:hypothetical protein